METDTEFKLRKAMEALKEADWIEPGYEVELVKVGDYMVLKHKQLD